MRTGIIAVLCMTLSGQALAWTAMPCCADGADSSPPAESVDHGMDHDMGPDMDAQGHGGCAEDNGADTDHTASDCCPGAFCSGVFAAVSPDLTLDAPALSADLFPGHTMLANAPPELLLRPPIA